MFSKFSTVVQTAANVLAPPAPLLDDFKYHWKRLMNHYLVVSPKERAAIELTNIPFHLDSLYEILMNEKSINQNKGETGVCLEFLLQNKMMNFLATLGTGDDPPGMKQYVLRFTCKIINQFYNPLLAHSSIYKPIQRLIESCDGNLHSASENDELHFLFLLSSLLRKEIPYAPIFFSTLNIVSTEDSTLPKKDSTHPQNILDALLTYINSADTNIRIKVCQAIMLLVSLNDNQVSDFIVTDTNLTFAITTRLINLFDEIQDKTDIDCIQEINVSWGLDALMSDTTSSYQGYSQLILFFSWFDFINQLIGESVPVISAALCEVFKLCFIECVFSQEFLSHSFSLAVLTKCITMATSHELFKVFREWLIGENTQIFTPDDAQCPQFKILIDNCLNSNNSICLLSLQLFTALIEKYDEITLQILVINFVYKRQYYDMTSSSDAVSSWSDVEDEREKQSGGTRTLAPSNIDKIIESYQSLFPTNLKSTEICSDYQVYLKDVEHVYKQVKCACVRFNWPSEALCFTESDGDTPPEKEFYEGAFLRMIFKKLENLNNQTYLINLELSNIISKLCLLPHPNLHEYLLNPFFPKNSKTPCLGQTLHKVGATLSKQLHHVEQYKYRLSITRKYLIGNEVEIRDNLSNLFESVIVLEEMCKELAAIVYVKCNCVT